MIFLDVFEIAQFSTLCSWSLGTLMLFAMENTHQIYLLFHHVLSQEISMNRDLAQVANDMRQKLLGIHHVAS